MTTGRMFPGANPSLYTGHAMYPGYVSDLRTMVCPSTRTALMDAIACPGGRWCGTDGQFDGGRMCKRTKGVIYNNYVYYGYLAEDDAAWLTVVQYAYSYPDWDIADANDQVRPGMTDMRVWVAVDHSFNSTLAAELAVDRINHYGADVAAVGAVMPMPVTGNGGSNSVYRLREGIERFLLTDIANASASVRAQTTIPLIYEPLGMFDVKSGVPDYGMTAFNHLPSGCNVLYLDGHVEFVKYPTRYPVDRLVAVVGPLY